MVKEVTQNSSGKTEFSDIDLYLAGDPIPVPEATESDSETSWALWEAAQSATVSQTLT